MAKNKLDLKNNKSFRYSIELAMAKTLLIKEMITDAEYKKIINQINKDYGVIRDILTLYPHTSV